MIAVGCIALGIALMPRGCEVGLAMPVGGGPCVPIIEPVPPVVVVAGGFILGIGFFVLSERVQMWCARADRYEEQ